MGIQQNKKNVIVHCLIKYLKTRNYIQSLSDFDIDSIFKAIRRDRNLGPSEIIKLLLKVFQYNIKIRELILEGKLHLINKKRI